MTIPDMAYAVANVTGFLSAGLAMLSVAMMAYGIWTRNVHNVLEKSKDLLATAKESRNVFIAFLAVLLFTVAPSVKLADKPATVAIADLVRTYCQGMVLVLLLALVCSVLGALRGPSLSGVKEHVGAIRLHAMVLAIAGMIMTYATTLS